MAVSGTTLAQTSSAQVSTPFHWNCMSTWPLCFVYSPSIRSHFDLAIHSFIYSFMHSFVQMSFIQSIPPSIICHRPFIDLSVTFVRFDSLICRLCSFSYYFFHRSIHPSFVCSFVSPYVVFCFCRSFFQSFVVFVHLYIHSFIYRIRSSIPSATVLTLSNKVVYVRPFISLSVRSLILSSVRSPWYICTSWLGGKHQFTYSFSHRSLF